MARTAATTKLTLKVMLGEEDGKALYGQRSFSHINPELSDEDALSIGRKLGALQAYELAGVNRTDAGGLSE